MDSDMLSRGRRLGGIQDEQPRRIHGDVKQQKNSSAQRQKRRQINSEEQKKDCVMRAIWRVRCLTLTGLAQVVTQEEALLELLEEGLEVWTSHEC